MPEATNQEERTESATPRRREEARKKGQVAKSMELSSAFMFLVGLVAIRFVFPSIFSEMMSITKATLSHISDARCPPVKPGVTASSIQHPASRMETDLYYYGVSTLMTVGKALAPFMMVMFASALVINYAQVGFLISGEALTPKLERLNPVKGISRLFSTKTIVTFVFGLSKIAIVGYVLYITMKGEHDKIMSLTAMPIKTAIAQITGLMFKMGIRAALLFLALGVFDYAYQRWEYERSLRMTKQEIKEEMKQSQGDPMVKARIRSVQREMARRRMMQEVPKADVVITNPTALAVALKYDMEADAAPKICGKGARLIAERIKAIAREHNVPIVENKPLAQALYKLELKQEIPIALYRAVAEILSRVYSSISDQ